MPGQGKLDSLYRVTSSIKIDLCLAKCIMKAYMFMIFVLPDASMFSFDIVVYYDQQQLSSIESRTEFPCLLNNVFKIFYIFVLATQFTPKNAPFMQRIFLCLILTSI